MTNNEMFESKWAQVRSQSRLWWSLFSDEDLDKVEKAPVKRDKYVTMLQVKYGYTRDRAREEVSRRIAGLPATPPASEAAGQQAGPASKSRSGKGTSKTKKRSTAR